MKAFVTLWIIVALALIGPGACNDDESPSKTENGESATHADHDHSSHDHGDGNDQMAGADDATDPWAGVKVGDMVKIRTTAPAGGGVDAPASILTRTVKSISQDKVVLSQSMSVEGMPTMPNMPGVPGQGGMPVQEITVQRSASALPTVRSLPASDVAAMEPEKTGTETLTIAGKAIETTVYEAQAPTVGKVKYWLSPQVPGGLVRMQAENGLKMEVLDFKKD
jgi:hypothetical protein